MCERVIYIYIYRCDCLSSWMMATGLHRRGKHTIVGNGLIQYKNAETILTYLGSVWGTGQVASNTHLLGHSLESLKKIEPGRLYKPQSMIDVNYTRRRSKSLVEMWSHKVKFWQLLAVCE